MRDQPETKKAVPIAIVGVGNCAKSLVEGISHYRQNPADNIGLRHPLIGPFAVGDIEVVAAFDIDERKVGKPLKDAIDAQPNRTISIGNPPHTETTVLRGPTYDGITEHLANFYISESPDPPVDVTKALTLSGAEIVVNYLPTGSNQAARWYAEAALSAGCSFVNCMPARLMRDESLRSRFASAQALLLGDDIKSQVGATIVNRALLELLGRRGAHVTQSVQKNYGGNADHFNLQFRGFDKKQTKTEALTGVLDPHVREAVVEMTYREELFDHKQALLEISAEIFGHAPIKMSLRLQDEDSPNSAGIVVDAIRMAKVLRDADLQDLASDVCASLMKAPPVQMSEEEGERRLNEAISQAIARLAMSRGAASLGPVGC